MTDRRITRSYKRALERAEKASRPLTHNEKVLALLSDGKPHSHRELYGLYVMGHSRVADLRKRGHDIRCWREGDLYLYQLTAAGGTDDVDPSTESPVAVSDPSGAVVDGRPFPSPAYPVETANRSADAPLGTSLQLELTVAA